MSKTSGGSKTLSQDLPRFRLAHAVPVCAWVAAKAREELEKPIHLNLDTTPAALRFARAHDAARGLVRRESH
jgi:hypothetical protein